MAIQSQQELDFEKQLVDHKTHSEMQRLNLTAAFTYVAEGIKAAFLLNGAAGIALMTFIGGKHPSGWPAISFRWPLMIFSLGAALAVVTLVLAYLSQAYFSEMNLRRQQRSAAAAGFRIAGLLTFGGSVLAFVVGLWLAATKF